MPPILFPRKTYFTGIKNLLFLVDCVINTYCVIITRLSTQSVSINNFYRRCPAVNTGSNVPTFMPGDIYNTIKIKNAVKRTSTIKHSFFHVQRSKYKFYCSRCIVKVHRYRARSPLEATKSVYTYHYM